MAYDAVIVDSHVVLPDRVVCKNIILDEGRVVGLTSDVPQCDHKINGRGLVSVPGPIDTHVHYGVYSPIDQAARTESHAAAIGGITTMMRMLRLEGLFSDELPAQLDAASRTHHIDYTLHASIFNPAQVGEMGFCVEKGITSFKIYMNLGGEVGHVYMDMPPGSSRLVAAQVDVTDDIVEKTVMAAASLGCPVLVHAEDYESCGCGIRTARERRQDGLSAWSHSRSPESEAKAIRTVSKFGRKHGCVIYFVHVGSARALAQIQEERQLGTKIFVETCPHYLTLSYETQKGYLAKVMPPIRALDDQKAVWGALSGNLVDTVGTDHVANRLGLKLGGDDVWGALAGFPGIGTILPILINDGVNRNRITLEQFARVTSYNAARIFGMHPRKGEIAKGSDADITMIDLKKEKKVTPDLFGGFSDYAVYDGMVLRGWPVRTIVRGETVAEDFEVIGRPGHGALIRRKAGMPPGPF